MVVILSSSEVEYFDSAVRLARYANILPDKNECAFFGVRPDNTTTTSCGYIWQKNDRDMVARYLMEAQTEIETEVGFPLNTQWIAGTVDEQVNFDERLVDEQDFRLKVLSRWGRVKIAGIRTVTTIQDAAVVNHATDPATVGPIATTVTDPSEVRIYFPSSNVEIDPNSMTISGGFLNFTIPRCRLVKLSHQDNPKNGIQYSDMSAFETVVDIKRVYTDTSTNAKIVVTHGDRCSDNCNTEIETGCVRIDDARLGILKVNPALHRDEGGGWYTQWSCGCPVSLRLYYKAGYKVTPLQAEDAITRLAHSKMPEEPCGCDKLKLLWRRDREIPSFLTRERINCPFGLSNGAWISWRFSQTMKLWRMGGTS